MFPWGMRAGPSNIEVDLEARSAARSAVTEVDNLRGRVRTLEFALGALWLLMKERHGYTDQDLAEAIARLDAEDGKIDGEISVESQLECPQCGRKRLTRAALKCSYCGTPLTPLGM